MKVWIKIAIALIVALPCPAFCAEVAVLHNGFSINHERRQVIGTVTRLYTSKDGLSYVDIPTTEIERFETVAAPPPAAAPKLNIAKAPLALPPPAPKQNLDEVVGEVSGRHHIDPDFINSVIKAESGYNSRAVSPKGAQGLMQLMPGTASQLGVKNAFDPQSNVEGGTKYLRDLLEMYDFDIVKALAAYNAGPHRVDQYHGVPPYYETRAYIARIIRDFNRKKLAEQKAAALAAKSTAAKAAKKNAPTQSAKTPSVIQQAVIPNKNPALTPTR